MNPTVLDTPCREYQGTRDGDGYGVRYVRGSGRAKRRYDRIHRWAWEQANGPIPAGMVVLHLCDNPPCFNVEHLAIGTQADNLADMAAKGRGSGPGAGKTHCVNGHLFDEANTYYRSTGHRQCKACKIERQRRQRATR